jgi:hypothetical protein
MFKPELKTKWNVLSLGAGVQSSALALMAEKGEITPKPDFAVFADTQAEPDYVYEWLEWLKSQLSYPVFTVTAGSIEENSLIKRTKKTGENYLKTIIPIFGKTKDGEVRAAIGRNCTIDYKIRPLNKFVKEKCNIKRGQKEPTVTMWIGISWDEIQRMKPNKEKWVQNRWPLLESKINRWDCHNWMKKNGYPESPRSSCYFCPFHKKEEWRALKEKSPVYFNKAIEFDKKIREEYQNWDEVMRMEVYLHRSCKPLGEIDFRSEEEKGQLDFDFMSECEGMCGI